ncbi:glycosyltransferase family 2 protein [Solitalea lacus]|uniref:glycosyltransferase family 2 protein n=1 Tax=Solitalea lacus TaxID=2911172 RepID=UPI001EDB9C32|nr:glycosyltransferase family 2 protein [Solitalea lacus]UKJ07539.1 glycosyltransferase family 2 protein [Solitalea lacus]
MPQKLSAVIITYNEEKNIERCIKSLTDWVDEIIVVDSKSTDSTPEICKKYPVKFISVDWMGYGPTKNFGAENAANEYILSIDADEAISAELKDSILKEKNKGFEGVYSFNRLTSFCGKWIKHGDWYPDTKDRIYPKSISWNASAVHEDLLIPPDCKKNHLKGDLLHYSYYQKEDLIKKYLKYAELGAADRKGKSKPYLLFKAISSPIFYFIKNYFFKRGFLDGKQGFFVNAYGSYYTFLKYKLAFKPTSK